jgi:hypothetical protein
VYGCCGCACVCTDLGLVVDGLFTRDCLCTLSVSQLLFILTRIHLQKDQTCKEKSDIVDLLQLHVNQLRHVYDHQVQLEIGIWQSFSIKQLLQLLHDRNIQVTHTPRPLANAHTHGVVFVVYIQAVSELSSPRWHVSIA